MKDVRRKQAREATPVADELLDEEVTAREDIGDEFNEDEQDAIDALYDEAEAPVETDRETPPLQSAEQPADPLARNPSTWTPADILNIIQNTPLDNKRGGIGGRPISWNIGPAFRLTLQFAENETRLNIIVREGSGGVGINYDDLPKIYLVKQVDAPADGKRTKKFARNLLAGLTEQDIQGAIDYAKEHGTRAPYRITTTIGQAPPPDTAESTPTVTSGVDAEDADTNILVSGKQIERKSPLESALERLNISPEDWEQRRPGGDATVKWLNEQFEAISKSQGDSPELDNAYAELYSQIENITPEEVDTSVDADFFDKYDFITRDITDAQRQDFDKIRRGLFLARTIARLEAKGRRRTREERIQLDALRAVKRTLHNRRFMMNCSTHLSIGRLRR